MALDLARIRRCLKDCDLATLFTQELGWDHHPGNLQVTVEGQDYTLLVIAQKRGMVAYQCPTDGTEEIPDYATRRKIERQVARSVHEHIVVFTDADQEVQVWQWVKREAGRPASCREHTYHTSQPGDALIQKLAEIEFTLEEEEGLTIVDVAGRTRAAFDVDRVTRRFYDRFKTEHAAFLKFIKGIPSKDHREWYASLMLNRLMFVYFIEKKGFLDGDTDYLRNRLQMIRQLRGKDKFLSFYRHFLLRLFHEGLGSQNRTSKLDELLGTVPYLDGGLFDVHELEEHNQEIAIPDKAFEKLFDFFDAYQWHLDERPLRKDDEINPDVLGYIFEKYINQKQMGAYYTKEDITDYIAKNTVLPFLFDAAEKKCAVAFERDSALWSLLRDDPDRYIYPAVRHGVIGDKGNIIPMPAKIAAGIDDVSKRGDWNRPAEAAFASPTETWREYVARRRRCLELREKLVAGEVHKINDLITLNLDICRFAQDAIENSEGPELLRAFYSTIAGRLPAKSNERYEPGMSILDPTCGSGAFLFAALNILEPLYDACLERMARFLEEADQQVPESVEEAVKTVIAVGESSTVEFKSTARWNVKAGKQDKEMENVIVKTVAALLNTKGGILLIGVEDDGCIFGLNNDYKLWGKRGNRDAFENWLITKLSDQFGRDCAALVAVDFCRLEKKDVCRVVVQPSPTAVYVKAEKDEQFFMRTGNTTRELTAPELIKYHKQRFEREKPSSFVPPTQRQQYSGPAKHRDFRRILDSVAEHPNLRYFVLKSIIIDNLFGVDIMEEAVEICKLRLFLKLVAQVEAAEQIEPLPDIDFNIRAGNTLVGYTSLDQVRDSVKSKLGLVDEQDEKALAQIEEDAEVASRAHRQFREMQTDRNMDAYQFHEAKLALRRRLDTLSEKLDRFLCADYGIDADAKPTEYEKWQACHKPFHWFTEFYGTMTDRGFDVIIGNPPYVEYHKVRDDYQIRRYTTERCGNLYAYVLERCFTISQEPARIAMIVQLSAICTDRMQPLQEEYLKASNCIWASCYDDRPGKLFDGLEHIRATIVLSVRGTSSQPDVRTTNLIRWYTETRSTLFASIEYGLCDELCIPGSFPKCGDPRLRTILHKMRRLPSTLREAYDERSQHLVHYYRSPLYWIRAMDFLPHFRSASAKRSVHHFKDFQVSREFWAPIVGAIINSSVFYMWFISYGNGRNVAIRDIITTPIPATLESPTAAKCFKGLFGKLMQDYKDNSIIR